MPTESTCDDCSHCKLKTEFDGTCFRFPPTVQAVPSVHSDGVFDDVLWHRPLVMRKELACGEFNRAVVDQSL